MRWPRLRLSVRWLMLAIVVVALVIEAEVIRRNRAYYLERGAFQARRAGHERNTSRMAQDRVLHPVDETETGMFRYIAKTRLERAGWHDALRRKWERGVSHPWERVEPDPPTPEDYGPIDFVHPNYPQPGQGKVSAPEGADREAFPPR